MNAKKGNKMTKIRQKIKTKKYLKKNLVKKKLSITYFFITSTLLIQQLQLHEKTVFLLLIHY